MTLLLPDKYATRLSEIDISDLRNGGVRGIIMDLDNTLVGYREQRPAPEVSTWVERALGAGFRLVIVSNNVRAWVEEIATGLKIAFVHKAAKPLPLGFGKALQLLQTARSETIVIGDQFFTDVLGAKLSGGLHTILNEPFEAKDFPVTMFFRFLENLMLPKHRRQ